MTGSSEGGSRGIESNGYLEEESGASWLEPQSPYLHDSVAACSLPCGVVFGSYSS